MTKTLSNSAQSVQDFLAKMGHALQVVELPSSARTADDAAKAIGCTVAQIVKSLVFHRKGSNKAILILVSGVNRVNEKALSNLIGEKIEKADANFVREVTGFAIGGIPPVGHKQPLETLIDMDLLKWGEVWAAAGTPNAVFCLNPAIIEGLTAGRVISVT